VDVIPVGFLLNYMHAKLAGYVFVHFLQILRYFRREDFTPVLDTADVTESKGMRGVAASVKLVLYSYIVTTKPKQNNSSWKNKARLSSPSFALVSRAMKAQGGDFPAGELTIKLAS